ncbi:MAG: helix-turn-helix transcriptional regulator [Kiritimatiellae bacterium]|nr:helix-turn-helix transcriptional regulator [Kiritimatiellia bacterium]
MDTPRDFLAALRRGRLAAGLTQSALAQKVGCKQSALSMLEHGSATAVSRETLARIADAVGVELPPEPAAAVLAAAAAAPPAGFAFCPDFECPTNMPYFVGSELLLLPLGSAGAGRHCAACGELLERACRACGAPVRRGCGCCTACGAPLVAAPAAGFAPDPRAWAAERRAAAAAFSKAFAL